MTKHNVFAPKQCRTRCFKFYNLFVPFRLLSAKQHSVQSKRNGYVTCTTKTRFVLFAEVPTFRDKQEPKGISGIRPTPRVLIEEK